MDNEKLNRIQPIDGAPGWYVDPDTGETFSEPELFDPAETDEDGGELADQLKDLDSGEEAKTESDSPEGETETELDKPDTDTEPAGPDDPESMETPEKPEEPGERIETGPEETMEGTTEAGEIAEAAEAAETAEAVAATAEAAEAAEVAVAVAAAPEEGAVAVGLLAVITVVTIVVLMALALMGWGGSGQKNNIEGIYSGSSVPLYKQWDPRWGSNGYGCGGTTISSSGCGVTSLAMIITYLTGNEVLPSKTAKISLDNGWRVCNQGTSWSAMTGMPSIFGLTGKAISWSEAKKYLEQGVPIIQSHGPGYFTNGGHFIVLTKKEGSKYLINDPDGKHREEASEEQIMNSLKQSWVVQK